MINVLIPTDFSLNAQKAIRLAIGQFDLKQAHFVLYHSVVQPRSFGGMLVNITDIMLNDAKELLEKEMKFLKEEFGKSLKIKAVAKVGYLENQLTVVVRKELIDLVAMGTKGESDIASKLLGSNAEHVIRKSEVPVLAIPSLEPHQIKKILIATELEEVPMAAEMEAIFESLNTQVDVEALTVLTDSHMRAAKSLHLHGRFVPVMTENAPKALEGIRNYLTKTDIDLLVIFHEHNSSFDYFFSRSITKKIAGSMYIPLLVIPSVK